METAIDHMTVVRYYRDRPGWTTEEVVDPPWPAVESAIRRMDNYCYPTRAAELREGR